MVSDLTGKNNEIKIHRHLASQSVRTHPGSEHVIALLDYFTVHGVNGEHDVLVFPVVGPHLGVMLEKYQDEINQSVKSLLRQIALGASFLHDCGIVHAGQRAVSSGDQKLTVPIQTCTRATSLSRSAISTENLRKICS